MNAEQKQRATELVAGWRGIYWRDNGNLMAALLQELIDAPEAEPVAKTTGYYGGHLTISTVDGRVLPFGTALYLAPPAPSVPDGWREFLTDVITAAGLLDHGKRDKGLADRIGSFAFDAMRGSTPTPAEAPADLVRDAEPWKLLLENLVEGLNKTYWSSWQGTAHFDEYLREAISAIERDKLKGQS